MISLINFQNYFQDRNISHLSQKIIVTKLENFFCQLSHLGTPKQNTFTNYIYNECILNFRKSSTLGRHDKFINYLNLNQM